MTGTDPVMGARELDDVFADYLTAEAGIAAILRLAGIPAPEERDLPRRLVDLIIDRIATGAAPRE